MGLSGRVAGRVPGESEDMGYGGGAPSEDADVPGLDTGDGMLDELMDDADDEEALAAVVELVEAGLPRRRAADVVARLTRRSRNTLYEKSLKTR